MRFVATALITGVLIMGTVTTARGEYESVGYDPSVCVNLAPVLVEFSDGALYGFNVWFDQATGIDLMSKIDLLTTLDTVQVNDPVYGVYIDGISYKNHSNSGYGGGELWWHYWVRAPGANWVFSTVGASSRVVADGDADGWVYGRAGEPRPLPGDATRNVLVDEGDLSLLCGNWMSPGGGLTWSEGDFTGDGLVNESDFSLLVGNWRFGVKAIPPSPPLPEPATALLLAAGVLLFRRRIG